VAPLSRREKDPAAGEARRRKVATVLGVAGGIGSVVVMKSAATAVALWLGAPALGVVAVGALATMATVGSVSYISNYMAKRRIVKQSGLTDDMPRFSVFGLVKSMVASKPALMAGSMAGLAAVVPAAGMLALGSAVAGLGAGIQEYVSKRREAKEAGHPVEPFTLRNMFKEINHSKGAKKAFLISAGLGAVISGAMMAFTGMSTPTVVADHVPAPAAPDFNTASSAPAVDTTPMPEMAAQPAATAAPAPVVEPVSVPEASAPSAETSVPVPDPVVVSSYEIQKGDTLWDIAKHFAGDRPTNGEIHAKMHEIAAFNRIENLDYIRAGDTLNLPVTPEDFEQVAKLRDELIATKAQAVATHAAAQAAAGPAPAVHVMPAALPVPVTVDATNAPVAQHSEVIFETTDEKGVQQLIHSSGIIETRTPVYANGTPGAAFSAVSAPAAAAPVVVPQGPSMGQCVFTETANQIQNKCSVDPNAIMKPGSGIEFRSAADPTPFRVSLSATSAPMSVGDFLANHAVPEAEEAYSNGRFVPKP
jgi:hypothetical protein